ncbi:MAG: potassium/proton antiporter [Antricoccus sp.]
MSILNLALTLLIGTSVLLVAVLAIRISGLLGFPSLLIYLVIGVVLGGSGLGIRFSDYELAKALGTVALALILAEGGFTTRWSNVRPQLLTGVLLSTVGVAVSVAVMATAAVWLLGMSWQVGLILGAVVSSTDAAAVFSVLRRLRLPPRVLATLELESGLNDAPVILIVTALSVPADAIEPWWQIGLFVVAELIGGAAIGLLIGRMGAQLLRRSTLPSSGLYAITTLTILVLAFAVAAVAHTSGFLATYVAGVVLGHADLPYKRASVAFSEAVSWLAQIGLFIMLGLLVDPPEIVPVILPAIVFGIILLLVARPLSVILSTIAVRISLRDQVFYSWSGLRGAVPIVLATIPVTAGINGGDRILHMVFILVVIFTLVQGTTLPMVARVLGLANTEQTTELEFEVAALDEAGAQILAFTVAADSRLNGVYVGELRLPRTAIVSLILRGEQRFVPERETRIRAGDQLLVVTPNDQRTRTERRLLAVSRAGRLASWRPEQRD